MNGTMTALDTLREKVRLAKPVPLWVPQPTPGKEETTGYVPVDSSWIAGVRYSPERGTEMTVKKGGKNYPYPGFNLQMFKRWVAAKSPGKWWWRNVGYPTQGQSKQFQMQLSRWTGPVHPLFAHPQIDGPVAPAPFSQLDPDEAHHFLKEQFSRHLTPQHIAALTGWLPGTTASFTKGSDGEGTPSLNSYIHSPGGGYSSSRVFFPKGFMGNPQPVLENSHQNIHGDPANKFHGVSGANLLRQVRAAHEVGIPQVSFSSVWAPETAINKRAYNGGLHWPLMGANGYLPESYLRTVPPAVIQHANELSGGQFLAAPPGQRTFEHFLKSPLAREHYVDNPVTHQGFIDTTPGSYSRKAIERHVGQAAARHGGGQVIPDSEMPKLPLHFGRMAKYHPMTEHLIATGCLHPEHYDEYFEN